MVKQCFQTVVVSIHKCQDLLMFQSHATGTGDTGSLCLEAQLATTSQKCQLKELQVPGENMSVHQLFEALALVVWHCLSFFRHVSLKRQRRYGPSL